MTIDYTVSNLHASGETKTKKQVQLHRISFAEGHTYELLNIGLAMTKIVSSSLPKRNLVLELATWQDYLLNPAYVGCVVGPICNRLSHSQTNFMGQHIDLSDYREENGPHLLHSGSAGWSTNLFSFKGSKQTSDSLKISFELEKDLQVGDSKFRQILKADFTFYPSKVSIRLKARSNPSFPFNLTYHTYFDHRAFSNQTPVFLRPGSYDFLRLSPEGIPLGELDSLVEASFLSKAGIPLSSEGFSQQRSFFPDSKGVDHFFLANPLSEADGMHTQGQLITQDGRKVLEVLSNSPGSQIYTGNFIAGTPLKNGPAEDRQGVCIEPHFWVNYPNSFGEVFTPTPSSGAQKADRTPLDSSFDQYSGTQFFENDHQILYILAT